MQDNEGRDPFELTEVTEVTTAWSPNEVTAAWSPSEVTTAWPPEVAAASQGDRPAKVPSFFERRTVKAHVLAHVARSRRKGSAAPAEPGAGDRPRPPGPQDGFLDLPLPRPPRGSQARPRIEPDLAAEEQPKPAAPASRAAKQPAVPPAMPPLYAGIPPYAKDVAPDPSWAKTGSSGIRIETINSDPVVARRPRRARRRNRVRPLSLALLLLVVAWWSAVYCSAWQVLSMTERVLVAWTMASNAIGLAEPSARTNAATKAPSPTNARPPTSQPSPTNARPPTSQPSPTNARPPTSQSSPANARPPTSQSSPANARPPANASKSPTNAPKSTTNVPESPTNLRPPTNLPESPTNAR